MKAGPLEKKRKIVGPSYDALWWYFYEQIKDVNGVLQEFNLKRDLKNIYFLISFDNASNNIKSIDYFARSLNSIMDDKMFHQKCVCHILHLTVKAGIKT
jgi:hypothetical protein